MAEKIRINDLYAVASGILKEYSGEVYEATATAVKETAKEATAELKKAGTFKGTKYRASWANEVNKKATYTEGTVFNRKHYQLAHLLEFGHAKQNGGRTRAFPHIAPINDKVPEIFERKLKELL